MKNEMFSCIAKHGTFEADRIVSLAGLAKYANVLRKLKMEKTGFRG